MNMIQTSHAKAPNRKDFEIIGLSAFKFFFAISQRFCGFA
jgi:hypothetical protein